MKVQKMFYTNHGLPLVGYLIECPGCGMSHLFDDRWEFNDDLENPTFSPSMLAKWPPDNVCHSFVRDGKIQFLNDCTHDLKGKTVELSEVY